VESSRSTLSASSSTVTWTRAERDSGRAPGQAPGAPARLAAAAAPREATQVEAAVGLTAVVVVGLAQSVQAEEEAATVAQAARARSVVRAVLSSL